MKIICVAFNYPQHNKEMNRTLYYKDSDPTLFLKPDSSILKDGKPFYIPDFSENVHFETEIVVKINRLGKNIAERFAHRYYDEITVGIDMTARDLQAQQKKMGYPWEISKAFDNSAVLGKFVSKHSFEKPIDSLDFSLYRNNECAQVGNTSQMIYPIDKIISYASRFFTLKIGDLIYTGTPAGVDRVDIDDHLQGYLEQQLLLDFYIK